MFNPFTPIVFTLGVIMAVTQVAVLGNPPPVTRDQLGKLGRRS